MDELTITTAQQKRNHAWREFGRANWVQDLALDTSVEFFGLGREQRRGMLGLAASSMRKTSQKLEAYRVCSEEAYKAMMEA